MIVNTDGALYVFRKPIINKLISLGHEVTSISSESRYFSRLKEIGVKPVALDFARHSVSPFKNLCLLIDLYRFIRDIRPDIIHNFTHKPAIYGTVAARLAGVSEVFITVTGLGTLFMREDIKTRFLRWLLLVQYRVASRYATKVFFQNPDDMDYFISRKVIDAKRAILTNGSGIDLDEYTYPTMDEVTHAKLCLGNELGIDLSRRIVVLFPARGVREKGFFEFYKVAKMVNGLVPNGYIFVHLGQIDLDASTQITRAGIEKLAEECGVFYLGFKDKIKDYMTASDVVVLPSYREGTPRSLIEALALGKVVVTTDVPGCRETVIDGWNGYLCNIGDERSLTAKLLAIDKSFIDRAAILSRSYCVNKYDVRSLIDKTLECYSEARKHC